MGCSSGVAQSGALASLWLLLPSLVGHAGWIRPEALSHTLSLAVLVDIPRQHALQKHTASVSPRHLELLTVSAISSAVALKCQVDARVRQAHHPEASQRPRRTHNGPSPPLGVCVCMPASLRYMLRTSRLASADRTLKRAQRISVAVPFSRSVLQCTRPQSVACTANRTERRSEWRTKVLSLF